MATVTQKKSPPKPTGKVLLPVALPGSNDPVPAPVSTETKPPAKKRDQSQRRAALPAETATFIFNEAAYNAKPKRKGSQAEGRIQFYVRGPQGMNLIELRAAYEKAGLKNAKAKANSNVRWDLAHGYVSMKESVVG